MGLHISKVHFPHVSQFYKGSFSIILIFFNVEKVLL